MLPSRSGSFGKAASISPRDRRALIRTGAAKFQRVIVDELARAQLPLRAEGSGYISVLSGARALFNCEGGRGVHNSSG